MWLWTEDIPITVMFSVACLIKIQNDNIDRNSPRNKQMLQMEI